MEALGRDFNLVAVASGVPISLENASGITYLVYEEDGATQAVLTQLTAASGGTETDLDIIDVNYTGTGVAGTWAKHTQAAANTFTATDTDAEDAFVIHVDATQLADGNKYVELTVAGATLVVAILHGLTVQRDPANLASVVA